MGLLVRGVHSGTRIRTKAAESGGTTSVYAPICNGVVQIFQVDLACALDQLASFQLVTLRNQILQKLNLQTVDRVDLQARPALAPSARALAAGGTVRLAKSAKAASAVSKGAAQAAPASSLAEVRTTLAALEGAQLKQYLVLNKLILWPFWCELIPDWAFCWQELGEAPLQSDGSFAAEICFYCPEDFPDLYFEVVQTINGVETEISDPQIACSTYYNYNGSEEVVITVNDPQAVACQPSGNPGPGYLYVWPTAIGNEDLRFIDGIQTGAGTGLLLDPGYNANPAPWGGTLPLQMQLDPNLRSNNIRYYRWSYMFDGDSAPTPISTPVNHRYLTILPGPVFVVNSYNLGPQTVGSSSGLFEVPDPTTGWIDIDDYSDRPFAYFDSTGGSVPNGMCTLMLEFFDASGKFVPCANPPGSSTMGNQAGDPPLPGPFTFILPQLGGPPNTYVPAPSANVTNHGRLIFRIQVDNNHTVAEVPAVKVNGTKSDSCGLLYYSSATDKVGIDYVAYQPENFLDWSLEVYRGVPGCLAASIPPSPPSTSTSSGSPGLPATFSNTAGALLGPTASCATTCSQAAFAVNVYCAARATNGYSRQSQYDSPATSAFVLLTPCPAIPEIK